MPDLELAAGDARMTVSPERGTVTGLQVADLAVLSPEHEMFPMAPWCGRMRDGVLHWQGREHHLPRNDGPHAIHGTVRKRPWRVTTQDAAHVVLEQDLADPWPFAGTVTQAIALDEGRAEFTMSIAAATAAFPAQVGWHPWFSKRLGGVEAELTFDPAWQLERGEDYLPNGHRIPPTPGPWDDCFGMPGGVYATLTWPGTLTLTVASPVTWVVVYDQPAEALCVEPQTGPPNGLNTEPRAVAPRDPLAATMTWNWQRH